MALGFDCTAIYIGDIGKTTKASSNVVEAVLNASLSIVDRLSFTGAERYEDREGMSREEIGNVKECFEELQGLASSNGAARFALNAPGRNKHGSAFGLPSLVLIQASNDESFPAVSRIQPCFLVKQQEGQNEQGFAIS